MCRFAYVYLRVKCCCLQHAKVSGSFLERARHSMKGFPQRGLCANWIAAKERIRKLTVGSGRPRPCLSFYSSHLFACVPVCSYISFGTARGDKCIQTMHPPRLNALFGAGRVTDLHCWLIPGTRLGQLKYELLKQCAQAVEDFRLQKMRLRHARPCRAFECRDEAEEYILFPPRAGCHLCLAGVV